MSPSESDHFELLKAVVAVAASDGKITGRENGLIKALAVRAGVGGSSLDAMVERATNDASMRADLLRIAVKDGERAMQLLVATAYVDGHISEEERAALVDVSTVLGVSARRFGEIFQAGMAAAKKASGPFGSGG